MCCTMELYKFRIILKTNMFILTGVFLIPYFLIMVVCGIPMLYMELAVGQFTGRGPIGALGQICPLFKGKLYKFIKLT